MYEESEEMAKYQSDYELGLAAAQLSRCEKQAEFKKMQINVKGDGRKGTSLLISNLGWEGSQESVEPK